MSPVNVSKTEVYTAQFVVHKGIKTDITGKCAKRGGRAGFLSSIKGISF